MANSQSSGMLSRDQLVFLFDRFAFLTSLPDVKKRIADAVMDGQLFEVKLGDDPPRNEVQFRHFPEAVAITTAIQEEIFLEMGVDPGFGIGCLGKINMVYENDRDLMIHFYAFVAKEEMACDEADLGSDKFAEKMHIQQQLQEHQLEMLKYMRNFQLDEQSFILEKSHKQMQEANFDNWASVMSSEQIEEAIRGRALASSK